MNENLEQYRVFYEVAKSGSILRASERLFITQPAVSRTIKNLEASLGCPIFFRTSKGVKLTQEGEILFDHLHQAFNAIASAEKRIEEVHNLSLGEIRIGVSDTLCKHYLLPYLKLFNTLHPKVGIHVTNPTTPAIIELLKKGFIDFGLINLPFEDDQLQFKALLEVQDCFVVGKKYRKLSYKPVHLNELLSYPLILLEKSSNTRLYLDRFLKGHSVEVTPDFELGNIDLVVQFAKNDLGVASVIRNFIEEDLENGNLYELKLIEKIPPRNVAAVWLKSAPLSAAAKELIKCIEFNENSEI